MHLKHYEALEMFPSTTRLENKILPLLCIYIFTIKWEDLTEQDDRISNCQGQFHIIDNIH